VFYPAENTTIQIGEDASSLVNIELTSSRGGKMTRCLTILMLLVIFFVFQRADCRGHQPESALEPVFVGTHHLLFLLDCSLAMRDKLPEGGSQFDLARSVLEHALLSIPSECDCGLRVFGQSDPQGTTQIDCMSSALVYPIDKFGRSKLRNTIQTFAPAGTSCLVYAINQAILDVTTLKEPSTIFVLTGEKDSCGGEVRTAFWPADLTKNNIKIIVFSTSQHTFGEGRKQDLRILAHETNGKYYDSTSLSTLYQDLAALSK
jgi:hypothetical protein